MNSLPKHMFHRYQLDPTQDLWEKIEFLELEIFPCKGLVFHNDSLSTISLWLQILCDLWCDPVIYNEVLFLCFFSFILQKSHWKHSKVIPLYLLLAGYCSSFRDIWILLSQAITLLIIFLLHSIVLLQNWLEINRKMGQNRSQNARFL